MSLGATYWNARFSQWTKPLPQQAGYTVLVPVPGDLPVFLELALSVLRLQKADNLVETLVLPDRLTPQMKTICERERSGYPGDLNLVPLPQPERSVLPLLRNPSHNHGIQILTGVQKARGSHVVLHDSDLFLLAPDALEKNYAASVERDLHVAGVSPVWDTWFADRGYSLVATWEMIARRDWLRSYPPHMHMGHDAELFGEAHTFDTTLHPQALTDPDRIGLVAAEDSFVHFNYVISTYRHFQRAQGSYHDNMFRLVLIRVLIDLFAQEPYEYRLPSADELADAVGSTTAQVTFPDPTPEACKNWADFRRKLQIIIDGPWTVTGNEKRVARFIEALDAKYGYTA